MSIQQLLHRRSLKVYLKKNSPFYHTPELLDELLHRIKKCNYQSGDLKPFLKQNPLEIMTLYHTISTLKETVRKLKEELLNIDAMDFKNSLYIKNPYNYYLNEVVKETGSCEESFLVLNGIVDELITITDSLCFLDRQQEHKVEWYMKKSYWVFSDIITFYSHLVFKC